MSWYYQFETSAGIFRIVQTPKGWLPTFEGEHLGGLFRTPDEALDALADGYTDSPAAGSPQSLGMSADLADWDWCRGG